MHAYEKEKGNDHLAPGIGKISRITQKIGILQQILFRIVQAIDYFGFEINCLPRNKQILKLAQCSDPINGASDESALPPSPAFMRREQRAKAQEGANGNGRRHDQGKARQIPAGNR
jgi:hypothetical protein